MDGFGWMDGESQSGTVGMWKLTFPQLFLNSPKSTGGLKVGSQGLEEKVW